MNNYRIIIGIGGYADAGVGEVGREKIGGVGGRSKPSIDDGSFGGKTLSQIFAGKSVAVADLIEVYPGWLLVDVVAELILVD